MFVKRLSVIAAVILVSSVVAVYWCHHHIEQQAAGKTYTDTTAIPYNKTGLLLGVSRLLNNGHHNPYYVYRVQAAIELLKSKKIKYLVISGDNGRQTYDEPGDMRNDLIKAGIDSARIYLDYAGFRTFDSMVRLKSIFGQDSVTVISQLFHNERALYTASRLGIHAIGYNARDVSVTMGNRTQLRERLARVKAVMDFWLGTQPKFMGHPIHIPD
jgi:SanA protein